MATIIPPDALLRLTERGRAAGQLTVADLARELPVEGMEQDELALVIAHLEEAGIPVTLDEGLLQPRRGGDPAMPPTIALPTPPPPAGASAAAARSTAAQEQAASSAGPALPARPRYANGTVLVAGVLALVILLALVWNYAR